LQDIFTNTRQPWHPPGARGIYGGAVIAQCLAAGQRTVPDNFLPHSCHCYFLLAGHPTTPILFHVERVRDGRSFATRTVQARQRGRCIFTTTISFAVVPEDEDDDKTKTNNKKKKKEYVEHRASMPEGMAKTAPPDDYDLGPGNNHTALIQSYALGFRGGLSRAEGEAQDRAAPQDRKSRLWVRAPGKISAEGGVQAHLNALAYMSDSYFIGTVARIHRLWTHRATPAEVAAMPPDQRAQVERQLEHLGLGTDPAGWADRPRIGMLVSLDHSIYFHEPRRVRADQWMFCEMDSPWAGADRGVVMQRIFAKDGTLLASCIQEVEAFLLWRV
jgi:acyl-CoA thioesterase 8